MKIFFSAGEPSGDVHGANLIRALKDAYQGDDLQCVGFGGPKMKEAGAELMFDLTSLAVMWLGGVLWNIKTFFRLAAQAQEYFEIEKPDAVVLAVVEAKKAAAAPAEEEAVAEASVSLETKPAE